MVRRRFSILSLAILATIGARPCAAAPLALTGNVSADFNPADPNVQKSAISTDPTSIGVDSRITSAGLVSGWAIQNIWTYYDKSTDTLQVGIQTFKNSYGQTTIFGDADGNGNPGAMASGLPGVDSPNFGVGKSFAVAFASANPTVSGTPSLIAGIPLDKSLVGSGIDGFTVSNYKNQSGASLNSQFGASLGSSAGSLAFNPSSDHPQAEFTINNFSKVSGIDPTKGIWMAAYAGAGNDVVAGEVNTGWLKVPAFAAETPEPTTWMAWSAIVAGATVLRARRARQAS